MKEKEDLQNESELTGNQTEARAPMQLDVTVITLLESLAEGVVIINEAGKIILINNRFQQLSGYSLQEVIGNDLSLFLPDEARLLHSRHIQHFFSHPQIRPMGSGLDLMAKRKDNSEFPVEISLSFLKTESGNLGVAFITDITSRKRSEDELKIRNNELDAYARMVAHDLNSPLSGILGLSELLLDFEGHFTDVQRREYLAKIAEGCRSMSNVIKEMLVFATLKKENVQHHKVEMKILIENVIQRLRFQLSHIEHELIISENIPDCYGYGQWVEEIWFNFISNAIKYGGSPLKIEIGASEVSADCVRYYVKDNGSGISDDFKAVLFQENNALKDKHTRGFGLGLSIVQKLIDKLGGTVEVESIPEKGSTFSFLLKPYSETHRKPEK